MVRGNQLSDEGQSPVADALKSIPDAGRCSTGLREGMARFAGLPQGDGRCSDMFARIVHIRTRAFPILVVGVKGDNWGHERLGRRDAKDDFIGRRFFAPHGFSADELHATGPDGFGSSRLNCPKEIFHAARFAFLD